MAGRNAALSCTPGGLFNRRLCFAVVSNLLPFRLVDDEIFRQILLSNATAHRTTLSTVHLTALYDDFVAALRSAIDDCHVHISFDLWSSISMNHYVVISCQWISTDWKIERAGLSIHGLDGQNAVDIVKAVTDVIDKIGIKQKSVFSIVTDGAANEVSAANFEGFCDGAEHVWCFLHKLNLIIGDGFAEKQSKRCGESRKGATSNDKVSKDREFYKQFRDGSSSFVPFTRDRARAQQQIRSLCDDELIAVDATSIGDDEDAESSETLSKEILVITALPNSCEELWRCVRVIVAKFRKSHKNKHHLKVACDAVGLEFRQPLLYARTRWIGSYYEIERFNYLSKAFVHLMDGPMSGLLSVPDSFFDACRELQSVLVTFCVPINDLQTASKPTVSWQVIVTCFLHKHVKDLKQKSTFVIVRKFCAAVLRSIASRFDSFLDTDTDLKDNIELRPFLAAQLLDVTTRIHWREDSELSLVLAEYANEVHEHFPDRSDTLPQTEPPQKKRKTTDAESDGKDDDGRSMIRSMIFGDSVGRQERISGDDLNDKNARLRDLLEEAHKYIHFVLGMKNDDNPMEFWKKHGHRFPLLKHVARIVLGQPCGSYDTERKCSDAGNILTKKRNRLCNEKVDKSWMIYCNRNEQWACKAPLLADLYPKNAPSI